ncbi:MAG TPA: RNA pyrophosphohydrolase, partial [Novosphingobium sp.]|nr:RNA pyrophosphohydrolase [Novosphingobium sp.]
MNDFAHLPYRPCVGVMLVNRSGLAFAGKRIDNREGDFWQMPQGGIDDGEDLHEAAIRELWEETGVGASLVEIVATTREELFYDLPDNLMGRLWGGRYRGQRQHWLLARFLGDDADVRIEAHEPPEFCEWKW